MSPNSHSPSGDQIAIDREHEGNEEAVPHVALHRLHRHSGMPAVAVAVRMVGSFHRGAVVAGRVRSLVGQRIAHVPGDGAGRR